VLELEDAVAVGVGIRRPYQRLTTRLGQPLPYNPARMSEVVPSPERLLALVDRMAGQPVLMLVDLVADRFVTGIPKRISREAPVLILRHEHEVLLPGGGANAAANVAALGGEPLPVGVVGDDASGHELVAALEARGIPTEAILRRPGYRTPTKVRILAGGRHAIKQQVVRYDVEGELSPTADDLTALATKVGAWAGRASVAVLSDYGYGAVDPSLVAACRAAVGGATGTLLCDSRYRLGAFAGVDGATPNEEEAESLLGARLGDDPEALRLGGASLRRSLGGRFLLVTPAAPTCRCTAPTRWRTSPGPATP
jgi:rfaE bifunctional protein kinase chain/domain